VQPAAATGDASNTPAVPPAAEAVVPDRDSMEGLAKEKFLLSVELMLMLPLITLLIHSSKTAVRAIKAAASMLRNHRINMKVREKIPSCTDMSPSGST
jgi:hypothetical protein